MVQSTSVHMYVAAGNNYVDSAERWGMHTYAGNNYVDSAERGRTHVFGIDRCR